MPTIKLTEKDVMELIKSGKSNNAIHTQYGVSTSRIKRIRNGLNKNKNLPKSLPKKSAYLPKSLPKKTIKTIRKTNNSNKKTRNWLIDDFQTLKQYFRKGDRPSQVSAIAMFEKHLYEILD